MLKEVLVKDYCISKKALEEKILNYSSYEIDNICIPSELIGYIKHRDNIVPIIDFPLGLSNVEEKNKKVSRLSGYNTIDVVLNIFYIQNNMIKELCSELKELNKIVKNLRPILDYSLFPSTKIIQDLGLILKDCGISDIVLSTTMYHDDPVDDIIFSKMFQGQGLNCIVSNKFFTKDHYNKLKEFDVYGIRFLSSNSLHFSEKEVV